MAKKSNPVQRTLNYQGWEVLRARTAARRLELIQTANLSATLRRLLAVLHKRCGGKRWCWPSVRTLVGDLGYTSEHARRTVQRQLEQLRSRGLIWIEHRIKAGRGQTSSVYAIRYGALRHCTLDGVASVPPPRGIGTAPPWHRDRTPVAQVPHLECNRNELNEIETTSRHFEREPCLVGGDSEMNSIGTIVRKTVARTEPVKGTFKTGWATSLTRDELSDRSKQRQLWQEAIAAGIVTNHPDRRAIELVRFVATVHRARRDSSLSNPMGFVVSTLAGQRWPLLRSVDVAYALANTPEAKQLTPDQRDTIRGDST